MNCCKGFPWFFSRTIRASRDRFRGEVAGDPQRRQSQKGRLSRMGEIVAATAWRLSNPAEMSSLGGFFKGQAPTANLVRDAIFSTVWDWYVEGNRVVIPTGEQVDIDRMERVGETSVYSTKGNVILIEEGVPLIRLDDAFGQNTRRTLNRVFEKIDQPNKRRVDRRLLPLMFWMDVARKIIDQKNIR